MPITQIVGNRDLDAERIASFEAGYSTFLYERLKGELTLFYNQLSDLINSEPAVEDPTLLKYFNRGKAQVYGGEIGGELLLRHWLISFANYAHQQVDDESPPPIRRAAPRHKINGGIRMQFENGLTTNLLIHYVSKIKHPEALDKPGQTRETDAYTLVNIRAGYRFRKDKVELSFSIFNLLNDVHREHPLGDEIGTRVLGTLNLKF